MIAAVELIEMSHSGDRLTTIQLSILWGDVAWASYQRPGTHALIVKGLEEGSLAQPVGFTEVWNDAGSGAHRDVKIYRMDPPPGYTCLGYVAAEGSSVPDLFHYR